MTDERLQSASRLLDLLSDADRLRLIGRLLEGEWTMTALCDELGLKPQAVARHIRSLEDVGLIRRQDAQMAFDIERLREATAALRPEPDDAFDSEADDDARVLRSFVVDGRLAHLPTQRSRWLVVLRWLAEQFEPGVEYPERVVNEKLGALHEDHALLRRQLVDEGFMARDHGVYWRLE